MAKSQSAKPKTIKAKAPTKPRAKRPSKPSKAESPSDSDDESEDTSTSAPALLDKTFVLRLVLAKLETVKSCDWHDLAKRMGEKESDGVKPKKGRKKKDEGNMWVGTELHDIYHNTILPALKTGRALWVDDAVASDLYLPPAPPSPIADLPTKADATSVEEEIVILEDIIEDEEEEAEVGVQEEGTTEELILGGEDVVEEDDDKTVEDEGEEPEEGPAEVAEVEAKETAEAEAEVDEDEVAQIEVEVEKEAEGEEEREEGEDEEESQEVFVEIIKEKKKEVKAKAPARKLATTYRKKPASPTNITITSPARPTLGYRQSVISKAGETGKKRMRQAYSDDEDEEVNVAPVRKAAKMTPPPAVPDKRRRSSRKSTS